MKVRYIGIFLLALLTFIGCDDNTGSLGMDMLPDADGISAKTTTFDVTTASILADRVYAKTSTGYVGRFTDPNKEDGFGNYEASFLTELNCTDGFKFPATYENGGTMAGDTVVSIQLAIYYATWFGDSLNACRMGVYELDKKLDKDRYTDINPSLYYGNETDKKNFKTGFFALHKAYTAYDTSVPDSIRNATDSNGNRTYYPNVTFPLDTVYGNEILHLNRTHPEFFKNSDAFIDNVLKGVYIKTDYGDGTILYVDRVDLQMQFRFHYVDSLGVKLTKKDGTLNPDGSPADSLYYSMATVFASTKEVIQANNFNITDKALLQKRVDEENHTYLMSPAGIFTEATLPYDNIHNELTNDTLNAVKLTFTNYNQDNSKYEFNMSAPQTVLLLRKKDIETFFEENKLSDNVTSFVATHNNVATNQYTFRNIARLVTTCINEKKAAKKKAQSEAGTAWNEAQEAEWEAKWKDENSDWDKVVLIPVVVTYDTTNSSSPTMTGIQHDLKPSATKLKGGPALNGDEVKTPLKLEVTYTTFGK